MSIYKKQSDDLKTFDSAEEFLKYYDNNRKDIDNTHTRSLNLKFKINGHHLGRKQGKLILYPTRETEIPIFIAGIIPFWNKVFVKNICPSVIDIRFVGIYAETFSAKVSHIGSAVIEPPPYSFLK